MSGIHARRRGRSILCAALLFASAAHAQVVPTPGAVQETLPPTLPALAPGQIPSQAVPAAPLRRRVEEGGPQIPIERFEIAGNSAFSTEELLALVEQWRGQSLTLLEIYDVADALTAYYRDHGYTLASVNVPPQKVSTGVVRFEVVEGRVGAVEVEGTSSYSDRLVKGHLDELAPGTVLTQAQLDRETLLLNDLPGLSARTVVTPGAEFGTSDVLVKAQEKRWDLRVALNNYGRESVGEWRTEADVFWNNVTGMGDRLGVSAIHSQGDLLKFGRLSYEVPVNHMGTRVSLGISRFVFDVDIDKLGLPVGVTDSLGGDGTTVRLGLTHPLLRSRIENLYLVVGATHNTTDQSGTGAFVVDPATDPDKFMNTVDVGLLWNRLHPNGAITTASGSVASNLRASKLNFTTGTLRENRQMGRFRLEVSHVQPFARDWFARARAVGVYSVDPLLDIERFRIGGPGSVRAFPPAERSGDDGVVVTAAVGRHLRWFPAVPVTGRLFYDAGVVHCKEDTRAACAGKANRALSGIGIGFTATLVERLEFAFEAVRPTSSAGHSDARDGGRVWAGLTARF